jgi:glycerophosphoryl diester phosphodiesterase
LSRPLVIAHQGATRSAPENSLAAFRAAAAAGADAVELDVHSSADGALVVHHDETIPGTGHITRLSGAQVRAAHLANGEPMPTLAEALEAVGRLQGFIEVKSLDPKFDDRLLATIARGPNPSGYAVHSFDHRIIQRLGARQPALARGVLSSSYPVRPLALLEDSGATMLWQERRLVDRQLIDTFHGAGAKVYVWTVDRPEEMQYLTELGVDGICSNVPDVVRGVVGA